MNIMQLYCLVQAAKLKIILKEEKKQLQALALEERVQNVVQEVLMQQAHLIQQQQVSSSFPSSFSSATKQKASLSHISPVIVPPSLHRSTSCRYGKGLKQKETRDREREREKGKKEGKGEHLEGDSSM